jgi:ArsR family transcriptional regulator
MVVRLHEILKAASEPTRVRLLNLMQQGSICVCDLQEVLEIPQSTVSRHLAGLRNGSLVVGTRVGPRTFYSLVPANDPRLKAFYDFLAQSCPQEEVFRTDLRRLQQVVRKRKSLLRREGSLIPPQGES